jgi:DNA replication and repair protein RecF
LQLSEFTSQGFRNLSPDPVSFGAGVTLITGENAQGKTNLLEAISLLCGQRSFRGAISGDMARGGERFEIEGTVEGRIGSERIGVTWSREEGRGFTRGAKPAGFREISQLAPAVFLAPEHQELVTGSPSARRRFLDRLVLGLKPGAGDDLVRYAAALRERNALLARWKSGAAGSAGELEAWTEELVIAGSAVRRHRIAALASWESDFRLLARGAGGDYADIEAAYTGGDGSAVEMRAGVERVAALERRRGHTLAGPHRDDLLWKRRGRPLATEGSSGEVARTVALAKLAEWKAVAKAAGEPPLFGADDFDAGLSEASVEEFFETLPPSAAVLLTTAAPSARWARRAAAVLEVRGGAVAAVVAVPRALRAVNAGQGVR